MSRDVNSGDATATMCHDKTTASNTQEDSVLKCQKIEPKFKHGLDRLGIKVEVPNNINFDLTCPK